MRRENKHFVEDGFAVWLTKTNNSSKIDLHISEWVAPKGRNYIDIGVRIYNAHPHLKVNIYVPFNLEYNDVRDLSGSLLNEKNARAVFNAACEIIPGPDENVFTIKYNDRIENVIKISSKNTSVQMTPDGRIITFDFEPLADFITEEEVYLRFRIPHKSMDDMFNSLCYKNARFSWAKLITSPFIAKSYNQVLKVNEVRSLPSYIMNNSDVRTQKILKIIVTLFLDDDYSVNDSSCYKERRMETDLYEGYAPAYYKGDNTIVYQWLSERGETKVSHYNFFVDFSCESINAWSIALYVAIVLLLSVVGDII